MPEKARKLDVEQQLLVTAAADEILETASIHQQALVRMLAVANEHKLNAVNLLEDLRSEMRSATARDIPRVVSELRSGVPIGSVFSHIPGVVPESVVFAMAAVQAKGLQKPLNQALLSAPTIRRSESDHAQDTTIISKLTGLFWRFVIALNILTFVMLFVVPQFKDMFDEFGIELPFSMQALIEVSNVATQFRFVFALIFFAVALYLLIWKRHLLVNYFTRWIPSRWQQPVLTKTARKDRSLAWVVQADENSTEAAIRFVSSNDIGVGMSKRFAAAEKIEAGGGVMESLTNERVISNKMSKVVSKATSNGSAAWILRARSRARELSLHYRDLTGVRLFIWLGDFLLMFIGGWLAVSIFQSLISIIQGLTQ